MTEWRDAIPGDFAVIGDPVAHSKSPAMHAAAYRELGLALSYRAVRVPVGEVRAALLHLRTLGYRGVNVTVPHKAEALAACEQVEDLARRIGAVNTVRLDGLVGRNTDGPGFLRSLPVKEPGLAVILGAGGSAAAVAVALADVGWKVEIYNRTRSRAESLAALIGGEVREDAAVAGADLVINATSAGLLGSGLSIDWAGVRPSAHAVDLMYGAEPSPFMREALQNGLTAQDGRGMLMEQGALALEWWLGVPAPREAMLEAIS